LKDIKIGIYYIQLYKILKNNFQLISNWTIELFNNKNSLQNKKINKNNEKKNYITTYTWNFFGKNNYFIFPEKNAKNMYHLINCLKI